MKLSETDATIEWLSQFKRAWRADAIDLVDALTLVSHDIFLARLRELIIERAQAANGLIGLYAERELPKRNGLPHLLFKQSTGKPRRAFGAGPKPVAPTRTLDPEVGSEGILAWLVTELCRERPEQFKSHPGPDQIRRDQIRTFMIVTDFVGSGKRARTYIEAAWRVASVKSWHSRGLLRFEVASYSGTEQGRARVRRHSTRPDLNFVTPCPTVDTAFTPERAERIRRLCVRYDPVSHDEVKSLGFGGVGALIAFAHGCPNNAPRILHRGRTGKWQPLFPRRVTARAHGAFGGRYPDAASIAARLTLMGHERIAQSPWLSRATNQGLTMIVLLAALSRGPRLDDSLAARTGLTLHEVRALVALAEEFGWADAKRRLTDAGRGQLVHTSIRASAYGELLPEPNLPYYPRSLRAPR